MNNKDKLFIGTEIVKAVENQVKILLPHVHSKNRCMGWFCEDPRELIVTTKHAPDRFLRTFVHESCHMDQFLEQTELWNDPSINDHGDVLNEYLHGERKRKSKLVIDYTKGSLKLELDCEKRAVDKIIKYGLSIDLDDYIKVANVYLYSWRDFLDLRCWYDNYNKPYDNEDVIAAMPTHFLSFEKYWKGHSKVHEFLLKHRKVLC